MLSYFKLLPVASVMYNTLVAVIQTNTDKSIQGKITREEIETILKGQVNNVVAALGPGIVMNEDK